VKVILGGSSASKDVQELSVLIGERDERSDTVTISDYGARSLQRSTRRVAMMHQSGSARSRSGPASYGFGAPRPS
jgi:hypothetical protein